MKTSVAPSNPTPSPVANLAPPLSKKAPKPEEEDLVSPTQDPPNPMQLGDNQGGTSPPASTIQSSEEELSEDEEGEIRLQPSPTKKKGKQGRKTDKERREEATYKDKLLGSQVTLETMLGSRSTRQKGQPKVATKTPKGK